jgi:ADP-heptose:LPS heptosyltransferase
MPLASENQYQKILIIQMCRMGDVVQSLPLLKRLKEEMVRCEVTLLCIRESIELIRDLPLVDRFVAVPYAYYKTIHGLKSPSPKLNFLLGLPELRESYDLVVNLTHGYSSALICRAVRGKKKSGRVFLAENRVSVLGDWGKYLFCAVANRTNRTENLINLVDIHIGMGGLPHAAMDSWLAVGASEEKNAETLLVSCGWKRGGKLIALQLGANQLHRAWPVSGFVALGEHLRRHAGVELVLLGSPGETGLGQDFLLQSGTPAINLIGKTRIADLPALLKKCDLLISNDTGTTHIAAAVGTRVLGLYFSTAYFAETAPFGGGHVVLQVETPCSPCQKDRCEKTWCRDYLDVEAVKAAAEMMLFGAKKPVPDFPNLSVYRSRFLSNGTLIYAPVTDTVSERYQTGFIHRTLWESALGLDLDEEFAGRMGAKLLPLESFGSKIEALRSKYAFLSSRYRAGLGVLHEAALAGQAGLLPEQGGSSVMETLRGIDAEIVSSGESILRTFHDYEMMDGDWTNPLEAGRRLSGKYAKLHGMAQGFSRLLEPEGAGGNVSAGRRLNSRRESAR